MDDEHGERRGTGRLEVGVVREWHDDLGWGVVDAAGTPGGCFAHASVVEGGGRRRVSLAAGTAVRIEVSDREWEGLPFLALRVWPLDDVTTAAPSTLRPVTVVRGADLDPADPTPGMVRHRALELPLLWAGQVETAAGAISGWHHHERNETSLYVVRGVLRMEVDGVEGHTDAHAGDFIHVPSWTVHRESNPTDEPSLAVIARVGGGPATVNVER